MTFELARSTLVTQMATIAITSPITQTMKRVYEDMFENVADMPAIVLMGETVTVRVGPMLRSQLTTFELQMIVHDESLPRALAIMRSYRAAIRDSFNSPTTKTLGGNGAMAAEMVFGRIEGVTLDSGAEGLSMDFALPFVVTDGGV